MISFVNMLFIGFWAFVFLMIYVSLWLDSPFAMILVHGGIGFAYWVTTLVR